MSVSVIIVTYNSMKYFPEFLESILDQTFWQANEIPPNVFVIDNASSDGTIKSIERAYPGVNILRNVKNIGLSRAWNQGIKLTSGEYILILNPDLVLARTFLSEAVKTMESDPAIASVGGKLYRLRVSSLSEDGLHTIDKTNILDSCGLVGFRNRRFIERGSGEIDKGQYNQREEVFGISGACTLFRRRALEKVKFVEEYFDEDFFLYKEDIDMAWRLRLAGYKNVYNPFAIAYHDRRARSEGAKIKNLLTIKNRRQKENFVNRHSYKNHLFLLYKNSLKSNFHRDFWPIFWYELKKFLYVLIWENSTLKNSWREWRRLKKKFRKKRRLNMQICAVRPEEIGKWFE